MGLIMRNIGEEMLVFISLDEFQGGFRVPGIFYWPGVVDANRSLEPASTLDILPTVFRICGVKVPDDSKLDGRDIRSLLSTQLSKDKVEPFKFVYSYSDNKAAAYRKGPWKIHVRLGSQLRDNYGFKASMDAPLLFNVEEDIHERIDRSKEKTEIRDELLKELKQHNEAVIKDGTFWDR